MTPMCVGLASPELRTLITVDDEEASGGKKSKRSGVS
jgi:hypothetical protein